MKEAVASIGAHSNTLPRSRGITLPLVRHDGGKVIVSRLIYYIRSIPNGESYITPPQYLATYDLTNKRFIALTKLPANLEQIKADPNDLGPKFDSPKDIIPEYERIWKLYDKLIPAFTNKPDSINNELKESASDYLKYFEQHLVKPLQADYEKHGGDFLRFVKSIAN